MSAARQIIFVGEYEFPELDAAAVRTMSLARICRDLGFETLVIGKGKLRPGDFDAQTGRYSVEGIQYLTMNPRPLTPLERVRHPLRRLRLFPSTLESLDLSRTAAVVINASGSARHFPLVKAFCEKKGLPLICDVCEWYDPCQMPYGRLNPSYTIFCLVFRYQLPRARNFIVVSRLLANRFKHPRRRVLRVAAPFDVRSIPCGDAPSAERLVVLYAGSPGKKDWLREIVIAIDRLAPEEKARIEFRLLGASRETLAGLLGPDSHLLDSLGSIVKPLGRLPRERVLDALREAHFTILVRPNKRYANAGFPSKVAESLSAGVPVLTTRTSDLDEYLGDEKAALFIDSCDSEDIARTLKRALRLDSSKLAEMRRSARAKAEQFFDYRSHLEDFREFLQNVS